MIMLGDIIPIMFGDTIIQTSSLSEQSSYKSARVGVEPSDMSPRSFMSMQGATLRPRKILALRAYGDQGSSAVCKNLFSHADEYKQLPSLEPK